MDIVQPVLVLAGRTVLGLLLSSVFGVIGIGIAWAMFVFFGAAAHTTLLIVFMAGAGLGAGLGSYIAFFRVDWAPPAPTMAAMGLVLMLLGIGGAWGGFQFGANRHYTHHLHSHGGQRGDQCGCPGDGHCPCDQGLRRVGKVSRDGR